MGIKGQATRDRIVATALGLFHTQGYRNTSLDNVIRAADEALYRAKQGGRNRVSL